MNAVSLRARLVNIAQWLENACAPAKAAAELRMIADALISPAAAVPEQTYAERRRQVEATLAGDVWADRKNGKEVVVLKAERLNLELQHENGRVTRKWGPYLASTHYLKLRPGLKFELPPAIPLDAHVEHSADGRYGVSYLFSLDAQVMNPDALFRAALEKAKRKGGLSEEEALKLFKLGGQTISIQKSLIEMLDPGEIPGCEIQNSDASNVERLYRDAAGILKT